MTLTDVLFVEGVRTSTWAAIAAFIAVAIVRRDTRAIFAGWVWITGFETVFSLTAWLMQGHTLAIAVKLDLFAIIGIVTVPFFARAYGIRPNLRLMLITAALWLIWIAVGFPVNAHEATTINPLSEVLNEASKTMLALAYLWPVATRESASLLANRRRNNVQW